MIVSEANPFMSEIHDRMPVFLGQETLQPWLEGNADTETVAGIRCPSEGVARFAARQQLEGGQR